MPNIVKPFLVNKNYIKGIEIYENLENMLLFRYFKIDNNSYFNKKLPNNIKKYNSTKEPIYYQDKPIGYVRIYYNYDIELTQEEKRFLKNKKSINICVDPYWMPYEKIENGIYKGIGADFIKLFESKLDIKFKLIPTKSWSESIKYAKNRVCDILPLSSDTQNRREYMNTTKIYLEEAIVLATQVKHSFTNDLSKLKNKTIAITKDYSIIKNIKTKYPNLKIIETNNIHNSLKLVNSGEIYGCIDAISTMNYHINKLYPEQLKISGKLDEKYMLGMASNKDIPILNNILNKTIDNISKKEYQEIYNRWNNKSVKIIKKIDYEIIYKILIVVTIIIIFFLYRQYILDKSNKNLKEIIESKTKDLKILNESLENKVSSQVKEIREKELILLEQSKLASMGEMIGNIAHQWRQPLSIISTAATGLQFLKEYNMLTDIKLQEACNSINNNAQYLSKTIDDFRDFIKGDKEKVLFNLSDNIDSFLQIVEGNIKNNNILIKKDISKSISIYGHPNELIQSLINIFNNSKDAFKEQNIDTRIVFISTVEKENGVTINIKDNAGGIPEDILPHIFEPYFTTKHKSQGTGLGLHMTYNLILDGMKGNIKVFNSEYKFEGTQYKGVEFIITLPLS
ncbi:MAG: transporter substrate-binding domain-containing protein [Campylobacterota bacterium]|nr:transporter substrate-binding domain-containing protein [Campylobacterota bacterium]